MSLELLDRIRIILVEPTHPGNIGSVARAMKNMGLSRLELVAPRGFPGPEATARAANATDILDSARVHRELDPALEGATLIVGTSARTRRIPWPLLDPRACAAQSLAELKGRDDAHVAILFGRESRGLTNEELHRCHVHLHIPTAGEYASLNLAMAVQVVCYEMLLAAGSGDIEAAGDVEFAPAEEFERFFEHLQAALVDIGFFDPTNPRQMMTRLRRMFTRIRPDRMEIGMLRGILTDMQRTAARAGTHGAPLRKD